MPDATPKKRGSGAAHIGFSMFGARGPLLAPDDGNGAGSGGSNPTPPQPAAPAPQPAAPSITPEIQALIDDAAKKAKDTAYAEARRTFEGKAKGQQPKSEKPEGTNHADDPSSLLALRDAFDDATSEMKLTKGQRQLVREAVMSKRPGDVDAFVQDYATRAGWTTEQPMPAPAAPAPKQPAAARPLSDNGSPAGTPAERSSDPTKWTTEDVERFYASKNGYVRRENGELDLSDPRNSKIHREIRAMTRQRLANVRVLLGPRRSA